MLRNGRWRDHIVTAIIAFVSAVFGVALIQGSQLMVDLMTPEGGEAAGTVAVAVQSVAWVFIGIGAYTAAVVTANTFSTIVAGRVREIAQYRLLGATAGSLQARLALEGLAAGAIGAVVGWAAAIGLYRLVVERAIGDGVLPAPIAGTAYDYTWIAPISPLPAVFAIVTVWLAAYFGSRAVATVSPMQALSATVEAPAERLESGLGRRVAFWILMGPGLLLLAGGCAIGAVTPLGVLVAFCGGVLSFTAVVVGAVFIVPRLVAWAGGLFGGSAAAAIARGNALRSPRATTRSVIGMVIGVALIVMFVVALATMRVVVWDYLLGPAGESPSPEEAAMFDEMMATVTGVMIALVAVSAALAAIGMISNLGLAVIQRRRELGLLRAVGMSGGQMRAMILVESALTAIVAIGFGAILGLLYGWAGAQSTFGAIAGGVAWPVVPWQLPLAIVGATLALATVAAIAPARRATKVTPMEALAVA